MNTLTNIGFFCAVALAHSSLWATDFACAAAPGTHLVEGNVKSPMIAGPLALAVPGGAGPGKMFGGGLSKAGAFKLQGLPKINVSALGMPLLVPKLSVDSATGLVIGSMMLRQPGHTEQQVNPTDAITQAKRFSELQLSPAERARIAANGACVNAYRALVSSFESSKQALGFTPGEQSLNDFVPWYYQNSLPDALRKQAGPIVAAQQNFAQQCMEKDVPPELNRAWVEQAVGVITLGDKVVCTALRVSATQIVTAKHCFVESESGRLSGDTLAFMAGQEKMWFSYPAEPDHRYGLCRESLPLSQTGRVYPQADHVTLSMRATAAPVAPLVWSASAPADGQALYLRGFFPFAANESTNLGRLRSTSGGGCVSHLATGRCFFHACQTTPLMSGAPVFVRPEPGTVLVHLKVAGIHLGAAGLSDPNGPNREVCTGADGSKVSSSNFAYIP